MGRFLPRKIGRLSVRLLLLTVTFLMASEVVIFLPSVARFRMNYFANHIAAAHLAVQAIEATPDSRVSRQLADTLLAHVGAYGIVVHGRSKTLMIDAEMPPVVEDVCDLRTTSLFEEIGEAIETLVSGKHTIRILATPPMDSSLVIELVLDEAPLRAEMWAFGWRVLGMSVTISLITAALLYFSLQGLLVSPLRRLAASMKAFREDPEDASRVIVPGRRDDEVGFAERELATMQETVRQALRQKEHLAALGTAVTKINHDLRNILSTARLMSDGLADSAVPEVRRVAPKLFASIDRAVALCSSILTFTREGAPALRRRRFALAGLVEELAEGLVRPGEDGLVFVNGVRASLIVEADRDQLFRALQNLTKNAAEAGAREIAIDAYEGDGAVTIEVADDGPGLPPKARDNLFRPFAGSGRPGGTGLGLAIARELLRAHGGDIHLGESTGTGTVFVLSLPAVATQSRPVADAVPGDATAVARPGSAPALGAE